MYYRSGKNWAQDSLQDKITSPKQIYTYNFKSLSNSGMFKHYKRVLITLTYLTKSFSQALAISAKAPIAVLNKSPSIYLDKACCK